MKYWEGVNLDPGRSALIPSKSVARDGCWLPTVHYGWSKQVVPTRNYLQNLNKSSAYILIVNIRTNFLKQVCEIKLTKQQAETSQLSVWPMEQ